MITGPTSKIYEIRDILAKHGKHLFDTLVMLAEGQPWLPATH